MSLDLSQELAPVAKQTLDVADFKHSHGRLQSQPY